ncbi:helix-hairpin-helix domain-containing protein [Pseudomonas sp. S75]|uniref:ComEA family DNA-binding protein n=1 Tax=unclassified Pseudomonas TaxID=196821 RepID=UPI0019060747|nr:MULTISPECIES: helix-hairpin-helix domain-containing protein [unclassified Pseudomonas]MBJ9975662.1 helix-hairpin-helix domain-containing protein [Pseudomonas sp. S30]MBK0153213.1 helix-hairpin-helix domain-containing protein [Pseudomonas sp. S75]
MRKIFISALLLPLCISLATSTAAAVPGCPPQRLVEPSPSGLERPVNLNTASAEMLQRALSGIGRAKAEAIVAYRKANGAFRSVDELLEVKGIGSALVEKNRKRLVVH